MVTGGNDTYYGEHVVMYITVESQCCSPGTNILHVNYIQLKKKDQKIFKKSLVILCLGYESYAYTFVCYLVVLGELLHVFKNGNDESECQD